MSAHLHLARIYATISLEDIHVNVALDTASMPMGYLAKVFADSTICVFVL